MVVETRSMNRDLPTDICGEIFCQLPVKSLLRFRSVSKTWLSMIADPKFVKSHKHRRPGSISFLLRSYSVNTEYVVRSSESFEVIAEHETLNTQDYFPTEILSDPLSYSQSRCRLIDSVDGLFLFENTLFQSRSERIHLLLWNPSIRRFRILSQTPPEVEGLSSLDIGLGFDPSIEDYKHVRLVILKPLVLVYTLGTNSWKTVPFKSRDGRSRWFFHSIGVCNRVCFRGSLYWLAYTSPSVQKTQRMVSFDFDTKEFSSADLPEVDDGRCYYGNRDWSLKCASDGSSLALVRIRKNQGAIWWAHGEGGDVTWSKPYEFGSTTSIRDVLNVEVGGDGAVLLLRLEAGVALYDVEARKEKIIVDERKSGPLAMYKGSVYARPYVETLELLN